MQIKINCFHQRNLTYLLWLVFPGFAILLYYERAIVKHGGGMTSYSENKLAQQED